MRGFIVLCLATCAVAVPQYNYQQQSSFAGQGASSSFAGQGARVQQSFGGNFGQASVAGPSVAGVSHHQVAPQVIYNKQIFIHSAPEEEAIEGGGSSHGSSVLRKNLRVVIVRAPENKGLNEAALQLAKSASEDKTVVYVLTKQTDLGELQNQLSQIQASNPNKPEVHFVKYRTPEEAEHAQHSIQSQYDNFGGPTQVLDEGIAPVESFIGSLGGGGGSLGAGTSQSGLFASGGQQSFGTVSNAYLPVRQF